MIFIYFDDIIVYIKKSFLIIIFLFLYLLSDGKQIDPKLIRVIPILKKVSNAVPKPPSPTHMKRIGCSWSAFRGK